MISNFFVVILRQKMIEVGENAALMNIKCERNEIHD